jgi:Na+/H+-dicarboxylate symporter
MCIENKTNIYLLPLIMIAGVISGSGLLFMHDTIMTIADVLSIVFMKLLKLVSLPIIFLSITTTISGLDKYEDLTQTGSKVLRYTLGTTICAATIALILFLIIDPANMQFVNLEPGQTTIDQEMRYIDYLLNIIPSNAIQAFADNNVIGTLLIGVGIGVASLSLPNHQQKSLHTLFSSLYAAVFKITSWILRLVPLAIWAFVALFTQSIISQELQLGMLSLYLFCVVGANILQAVIILPLLLKQKGLKPSTVFTQMLPALQVAFWSKSSSAALPVALQCIKKHDNVTEKIANISLPLCISINMNGCAAFILITVFFVAKCNGVLFSAPEMLIWIIISTLTAVGNAGVPMGCYFLSCALLGSMGIPLKVMGFILPFYVLIDMLESAINVWSDICVTLAVNADAESELGEIITETA